MVGEPLFASSHRILRLAKKFRDWRYRHAYVSGHGRRFIAQQMRALRGSISQQEFGRILDKPQSVVSRLEDPAYGKWTLQTLFEVAAMLDRAVIVRIVDFPTFLRFTENMSEEAICPPPYSEQAIERYQPISVSGGALAALLGPSALDDVGHTSKKLSGFKHQSIQERRPKRSALDAAGQAPQITQTTYAGQYSQ